MRIILIGSGKMGRLLEETAAAAGDDVVGVFNRANLASLADFAEPADVVIDFSRPETLPAVAEYVRRTGTPPLSGTTNFSLGIAVLAKALSLVSGVLRPGFDVELAEAHHNQKADAPSGTAKLLVNAIDPGHELAPQYGREGNCGRRSENEIGIHSLRGGTVAGTHTVYFLGPDEELEFTHRAASRRIFVNGALRAAHLLVREPKGLISLDSLLFHA